MLFRGIVIIICRLRYYIITIDIDIGVSTTTIVWRGIDMWLIRILVIQKWSLRTKYRAAEEAAPEYSGKMLSSIVQGIQAEYSVGSENKLLPPAGAAIRYAATETVRLRR